MSSIKYKLIVLGIIANTLATSLTGCGHHNTHNVNYTDIRITYENGEVISGSVPYDDIYGNIKVVILEQNGTIMPYLMIKEKGVNFHDGLIPCTYVEYVDLKSDTTMLKYWWNGKNVDTENTEPDDIELGTKTKILEEKEFYDYLHGYGEIINNLDVMELIKIYNEIEQELIEYISKEYNYTRSINK